MKSLISSVALMVTLAMGCSASQPGPGAPAGDDGQTQSMGTGLQAQPGKHGMFFEADKDNDGKVTVAEANAVAAAKFAGADSNKDGYLDAAEMAAARPGRGPGRAGPGHQGAGPGRLDKNGDGKITKDEAPARMQERFDAVDANKDGALDPQELQAARGKHGAQSGAERIKRLDKNGDGKIAKDEAPAPMQKHFDAIDTNKDGYADAEELKAARDKRMHKGGPGQGPRAGMLGPVDADGDGKVSQAEFTSTAQSWFKRMDANNDGAVTKEELAAKRARRHGR